MNILVLNGSPKGSGSITLQTSKYLEILHPEHSFSYLNVGSEIKKLEKDFSKAEEMLDVAELIVFSYPVYTFIAPSQLHRFIEITKERNIDLSGKYATQISTSKHFYDVTAHNYIRDNCLDLRLKYIKGLSADMDDLTKKKGQAEAREFFDYLIWSVERDIYETAVPAAPMPILKGPEEILAGAKAAMDKSVKTIALVADLAPEDASLKAMIDRFCAVSPDRCKLVNIHDFPFKGGCISCFNCSTDGTCIYKDGFQDLLRNEIQACDSIVIAFSIRDHSMGSRFKLYDDRQFCNGHRTVTMGKAFGYLICGNLSVEENLRMVINGRAEVGGNFLAGVASNEFDPAREIDALAEKLHYAMDHEYVQHSNFLGVGGMKIFRDLIWQMQGMMKADHKFYKAHGQYDFPQKKWPTMLAMYLVGGIMGNQKIKNKLGSSMTEGMLMPYTRVLKEAEAKKK